MITIDNISYYKNQTKILENVGLTIGLGSCLLLTGRNGVGKTTLLKIICGIIKPSNGKILWNGQDIEQFYSDFTSDLRYIGHKNFLKDELTVFENLNWYCQIHNTELLIPSAARYFGLEDIMEIKFAKLSAGWQKKVLLSLLICCPATIWLLDEPTVNLDKQGKELLLNLINIRTRDGGVVLAATHDEILLPLGSNFSLEDFT